MKPLDEEPNPMPAKTSGETAPRPTRACAKPPQTDPGLARIIRAWPELPEAIRRAMLALVGERPEG